MWNLIVQWLAIFIAYFIAKVIFIVGIFALIFVIYLLLSVFFSSRR
jgi:hypothetical protein